MLRVDWEVKNTGNDVMYYSIGGHPGYMIPEGEKKEVRKAGIKYLVYMHLSVLLIISMFAMLTNISNSLDFTHYAEAVRQNQHYANRHR